MKNIQTAMKNLNKAAGATKPKLISNKQYFKEQYEKYGGGSVRKMYEAEKLRSK